MPMRHDDRFERWAVFEAVTPGKAFGFAGPSLHFLTEKTTHQGTNVCRRG